jgi:hypothetical protein
MIFIGFKHSDSSKGYDTVIGPYINIEFHSDRLYCFNTSLTLEIKLECCDQHVSYILYGNKKYSRMQVFNDLFKLNVYEQEEILKVLHKQSKGVYNGTTL